MPRARVPAATLQSRNRRSLDRANVSSVCCFRWSLECAFCSLPASLGRAEETDEAPPKRPFTKSAMLSMRGVVQRRSGRRKLDDESCRQRGASLVSPAQAKKWSQFARPSPSKHPSRERFRLPWLRRVLLSEGTSFSWSRHTGMAEECGGAGTT